LALALALAKAKAMAKAKAKSEELLFKTSEFIEDALGKVIVPGLKRVDAIARGDGKVIDIAREHEERDVVPGRRAHCLTLCAKEAKRPCISLFLFLWPTPNKCAWGRSGLNCF
jgi:hypothetical protein